MNRSWLDVKATALMLGVSKSTVYRYAERNELPHVKKKFGLRFKEEDLDAWLDKDKRKASLLPDINQNLLTNFTPIVTSRAKGGNSKLAKKGQTCFNYGFGSIYTRKTKSGITRWYIYYYATEGRRIREVVKHAQTREEALLALKEAVLKEHYKGNGARENENIKFEQFARIYIENYSMVKKRAWERSDKVYLNANLIPYFGDFELKKINTLLIERFIAKRLDDDVKKSTINRDLACLRKMLNKAIEWDYLTVSPFNGIKLFSEQQYKRDRVLTDDEEKRLYQAAALHLRPILTCALMTAMRCSEILNLKWENVDLINRHIILRAESTKSGKTRIIPINNTLLEELVRLKKLNEGISDFVFLYCDPKTRKLRPVKSIRKAFAMACKRANIKNLVFHDQRHTAAHRLLISGADPVAIQNLLGHASLKTTEIYLHSSLKQIEKAVELLNKKPERMTSKQGFLTRHRHTEKFDLSDELPSYLFSVN